MVVDDAAQGISDVVRGADLSDNTARQILLQRALGLPTPRYLPRGISATKDRTEVARSNATARAINKAPTTAASATPPHY